ncbi:hypothetical protein IIC65_06400 [Candidatus Sumerlaeota bacterium]|nr:hypothetical protein [Candidatus Sumerlaeota bacterium]
MNKSIAGLAIVTFWAALFGVPDECQAQRGGPKVGEAAPDFELMPIKFYNFKTEKIEITRRNAELLYDPVSLSSFRDEEPVVLIFGSYTAPAFRDLARGLELMYASHKDAAKFFIIYIKEAGPAGEEAGRNSPGLKYIKDATTFFERFQSANSCVSGLALTIPCLLDDMQNSTSEAYDTWPAGLFVIRKDGTVAYRKDADSGDFSLSELEEALGKEL